MEVNPRILVGDERTKFVTTVRDSEFYPEKTDAMTVEIAGKIRTRTTL